MRDEDCLKNSGGYRTWRDWPRNRFYTEEEKIENYRKSVRSGGHPVHPDEIFLYNGVPSLNGVSLEALDEVSRCRECLGYDYDNEFSCLANPYDESFIMVDGCDGPDKHYAEVVELCPIKLFDLIPLPDEQPFLAEDRDPGPAYRGFTCMLCRKITALSKYHGLDAKAFLADARKKHQTTEGFEKEYAEALPKIKALLVKYREGLDDKGEKE